jgi:hypothetical protein
MINIKTNLIALLAIASSISYQPQAYIKQKIIDHNSILSQQKKRRIRDEIRARRIK